MHDQKEQLTLFLLFDLFDKIVDDENSNFTLHDLFEFIIDFNQYAQIKNRLIREKLTLIVSSDVVVADWKRLNANQLTAINRIVQIVHENEYKIDQLFFMNDFEETEKIFVQNIVMIKLRAIKLSNENKLIIVLAMISSDIVVTLLKSDTTTHFKFKISLNSKDENICSIKKNSDRVELIKTIKLIFWDEILMQRKWDFMIVSRTFSDLCDVEDTVSFEKKIVCFCEDFKQCLSVVSNKSRNTIVNMCLSKFLFWIDVKILSLIINMRLQNSLLIEQDRQEVAVFAKNVLNIDDAMTIDDKNIASWDHEYIFKINSQQKLINIIYSDLRFNVFSNQYLNERIILAMINLDVQHINEICIDKLRENVHLRHNVNTLVNSDMKNEFDDECFHHYKKVSFSSHILRLKIDMSIMILRN